MFLFKRFFFRHFLATPRIRAREARDRLRTVPGPAGHRGGWCWTSSDGPVAVHRTLVICLHHSDIEFPLRNEAFSIKMIDFVCGGARRRGLAVLSGKCYGADIDVWVRCTAHGHRNSSSTIPRDAQQVQGPCGIDPGPPGRPQAGSGAVAQN